MNEEDPSPISTDGLPGPDEVRARQEVSGGAGQAPSLEFCPFCGGNQLRLSRRSVFGERTLLALVGAAAYRCGVCRLRFVAGLRSSRGRAVELASGRSRRRLKWPYVVAMLVAAVLTLLFVLYALVRAELGVNEWPRPIGGLGPSGPDAVASLSS